MDQRPWVALYVIEHISTEHIGRGYDERTVFGHRDACELTQERKAPEQLCVSRIDP